MHRGGSSLLVFLGLISFSTFTYAGQVTKVKGRGVLMNLEGEYAQSGDQFFLINSAGKKKAIVKVTRIKGDQAIGQVTAGKAETGMTTRRRVAGGGGGDAVASSGRSSGGFSSNKSYWGLLGGLSMNSMSVDLPSPVSTTVSLSGMSFSAKGLFDYKLFDRIWFRGTTGYQGFTVTGPAKCGTGTSACKADIGYLSFDFMGRYMFAEGNLRPWLGGGFSMLFPMMKSSTALETSSITNSSVFVFAGGVDWGLSKTSYIPISIEYSLFPKSSSTAASWIAVRAGYAFPF